MVKRPVHARAPSGTGQLLMCGQSGISAPVLEDDDDNLKVTCPRCLEKMNQKNKDIVNHPDHYTAGGIETLDYIAAKLNDEEFAGYLSGSVLKYISRYKHKNGAEDLKKAEFYLKILIRITEDKGK